MALFYRVGAGVSSTNGARAQYDAEMRAALAVLVPLLVGTGFSVMNIHNDALGMACFILAFAILVTEIVTRPRVYPYLPWHRLSVRVNPVNPLGYHRKDWSGIPHWECDSCIHDSMNEKDMRQHVAERHGKR